MSRKGTGWIHFIMTSQRGQTHNTRPWGASKTNLEFYAWFISKDETLTIIDLGLFMTVGYNYNNTIIGIKGRTTGINAQERTHLIADYLCATL